MEGGLDSFDVTYMCNFMRDVWGERFRSVDLVEVNPLIGTPDDSQKTLRMDTHVVTSSLIGERGLNINVNVKIRLGFK